jgi:hypothetical protein
VCQVQAAVQLGEIPPGTAMTSRVSRMSFSPILGHTKRYCDLYSCCHPWLSCPNPPTCMHAEKRRTGQDGQAAAALRAPCVRVQARQGGVQGSPGWLRAVACTGGVWREWQVQEVPAPQGPHRWALGCLTGLPLQQLWHLPRSCCCKCLCQWRQSCLCGLDVPRSNELHAVAWLARPHG